MPNSYGICMYMKAVHICAHGYVLYGCCDSELLLLDKLMLFSQCRAKAT